MRKLGNVLHNFTCMEIRFLTAIELPSRHESWKSAQMRHKQSLYTIMMSFTHAQRPARDSVDDDDAVGLNVLRCRADILETNSERFGESDKLFIGNVLLGQLCG